MTPSAECGTPEFKVSVMSIFDSYKKTRDLLVCVDSDGCAMDTMNCKHFHCFGPCMVTEWGLEEWKRRYKEGEKNLTGRKLRNTFNAIKNEHFPFTYEVTKCATEHAFDDLQKAYDNFFAHRANYPTKHKKKENKGSFYIQNSEFRLSFTHEKMKHLKNVSHNNKCKHQRN